MSDSDNFYILRFIFKKPPVNTESEDGKAEGQSERLPNLIPLPLCSLWSDPNAVLLLITLTLLRLVVCHFLPQSLSCKFYRATFVSLIMLTTALMLSIKT